MYIMKRHITLRHFNTGLGLLVIFLALYIFTWPFLPSLTWWVRHEAPVVSRRPETVVATSEPTPTQNTLLIPKLEMKQAVYDGPDVQTLNKGVWHLPKNSTPDRGGNTIIAGHRFTYSGKAVFYYLDKVSKGDAITLFWEGKRYDYVVTGVHVVSPTDSSLIAPTTNSILTIYTCTPLWSAKDRLVITAELMEPKL